MPGLVWQLPLYTLFAAADKTSTVWSSWFCSAFLVAGLDKLVLQVTDRDGELVDLEVAEV